jgi:two-component system chemotaxis response regulator CheB
MDKKIRVLIVEDSFLMRKIISDIISTDPQIEIVDEARNGKEALDKVFSLHPDVVTLDINLPMVDGLAVLSEIMQKQPTPVIMLSAYTRQGAAVTIKALELGAIDFIPKPSGEVSLNLDTLKEEIISKIKTAASVDMQTFLATVRVPVILKPQIKKEALEIKKLVVIGASTGGPRAILGIMREIPQDIPAAFLIVQHMPEGFTLSFAERISWESKVKAKEAEEGDVILPQKAYVAPGGAHLALRKIWDEHGGRLKIQLDMSPPVNFLRPSVDVTMSSAADVFSPHVIGVILTGMGRDGLKGARKIKEKGGLLIVQDETSSVVWGMPKAIIDEGLADYVLPISKIAQAIIRNIE